MNKLLDPYIHQQPDGTFRVDVRVARSKRIRQTFIRREDARACVKKALLGREDSKQSQRGVKKSRRTMADAIADYREEKALLRPATAKRYRPILAWLEDYAKRHHIHYVDQFDPDIHGSDVRRLLLAPRRDPKGSTTRVLCAAPKTVNLFLQTIRSVFQREVNNRNITFNPLAHVKGVPLTKKPPEFYSEEEITAFFSVSMPEAYRRVFLGLLHTGMRFEELANLRWVDIDFEKRLVSVTEHDNFHPKTQNALRSIPMNDSLFSLLTAMREKPLSAVYAFSSAGGCLLRERHTLEMCKRVAHSAGIGRAFLHKFRHTFATQLLARGASLEQLKALLGHSSIKETEMYAHSDSSPMGDVVVKLDALRTVAPAGDAGG